MNLGNPQFAQLIQNEDQMCKMVRSHFLRLREVQKNDPNNEKPLSEDIQFTFRMVGSNVTNPIQMLKTMGLILLGKALAINFSFFQSQVICCKTLAIKLLCDEGWVDVSSEYKDQLSNLIGANEVKNWTVYKFPPQSKFAEFLNSKDESGRYNYDIYSATVKSFGLDHAPDMILIGPGLPPDDALMEPHFPLVSIQYEKTFDTAEVADFKPMPRLPANKKFSVSASWAINIPYTV